MYFFQVPKVTFLGDLNVKNVWRNNNKYYSNIHVSLNATYWNGNKNKFGDMETYIT